MLKRLNQLIVAALVLAVPALFVPAGAAGASAQRPTSAQRLPVLRRMHPAPAGVRPRSVGTVPLRVPSPTVYAAQKATANAAAARRAGRPPAPTSGGRAPAIARNWAGLRDTNVAPSDSTGAIGLTRYIELVNSQAAIYTRTSNTPAASGPLLSLTGCATARCANDDAFDVQVLWDPGTRRFFYTAMDTISRTETLLDTGFSTTATPTLSASSWCRYSLGFGSILPDYPKLGDTRDFQLIGINEFSGPDQLYAGSSIAWVSKPPPGPRCPAPDAFKTGATRGLMNADGTPAFTPVPATQTDASPTGWAVAVPAGIHAGGASFLTMFKVTKSASGAAVIPATGTQVPVGAYQIPANAAQPGTANLLDTMDARNTQAISAIDPAHGGVMALWTQHTVFGGAGSAVRWYEINPAALTVLQHGTLSDQSGFVFDGAVSPDRLVNGTVHKFGTDMVIDVVQSSTASLPAIKVASRIGPGPTSPLKPVATSSAPDTGFDCLNSAHLCRWGDYAAATPDPAAPATGRAGRVWGTSMLSAPGGGASSSGWTTGNFAIVP
jgi:hypothetical protein